jgi:hypothetical protein
MSEIDWAERRRHPRYAVRFPLYASLHGEVYQKMVAIEARDVSEGGLAFETRTRLPLGVETRVMVSRLGGLSESAHIEARVVYCMHDEANSLYRVGVTFHRFVDVTAEQLVERLRSVQAD